MSCRSDSLPLSSSSRNYCREIAEIFFVADSVGISSLTSTQRAPEKKLYRVTLCVTVVQGHSRSSKSILIESPYAISYQSFMVTWLFSIIFDI